MAVNDGSLLGWPFVNHGMEVRGTQTERGRGRSTIVYPRQKFTFVVEFTINPRALDTNRLQTNLRQFLQNGRLYATLRAIDHPKPNMVTEKLRSYNKYVILPTKFEYQPATMKFHDDNSSIASALWKEIRAFYHYEGSIGSNAIRSGAITQTQRNEFRQGSMLTGGSVRTGMETRPSLGMRIKDNDGRHFFDAITIYDLGSDPDSINIYSFTYPVVTNMDHDGLDYEDRDGQMGMSMTFDYESYYQLVGVNNAQVHQMLEQYLGFSPSSVSPSVDGHVRMSASSGASSSPASMGTLPFNSLVDTPSSVPLGGVNPSVSFPLTPPPPVAGPFPLAMSQAEIDDIIRRTGSRV